MDSMTISSPKRSKQGQRRRLREASWKVLELLMSPQKSTSTSTPVPKIATAAVSPAASHGLIEMTKGQPHPPAQPKGSMYPWQSSCADSAVSYDKGTGQAAHDNDNNPLLVPLAVRPSPARDGAAGALIAATNLLNAQPLSSLPPFRSVSGTSAVSSVPSAGVPEEEESPLVFSANEEAIMDAILGI